MLSDRFEIEDYTATMTSFFSAAAECDSVLASVLEVVNEGWEPLKRGLDQKHRGRKGRQHMFPGSG